MPQDRYIIEVKGLVHTYLPGTLLEVCSLHGIDFQVQRDETAGIIGPTGSGKSTLLHHLNRLIKPQQGDVFINGISLSHPSINILALRQMVGLVFQNPEDQLFERYAGDDVAFGPRNMNLSKEEVRKRVRDAMELVGLPFSYKDRLTSDLSHGEKRRLALAGVLAMEPQVLVLDEPTASLDPAGRQSLLDILSRWRSRKGKSMVVVSHSMEDIAALADYVWVLVKGKMIFHGNTREVFASYDLLLQHGLSVPVPAAVMHRLRENGYSVSPEVLTIDEAAEAIKGLFNVQKNRI